MKIQSPQGLQADVFEHMATLLVNQCGWTFVEDATDPATLPEAIATWQMITGSSGGSSIQKIRDDLDAAIVTQEQQAKIVANLATHLDDKFTEASEQLEQAKNDLSRHTDTLCAEIVDYAIATYAEKSEVQDVQVFAQSILDAMNGPDATVESITQMFWMLNDVIYALMEATGVEFPGRTATPGESSLVPVALPEGGTSSSVAAATSRTVQEIMDAICGPGSTPEDVQETMYKLNDILEALMEASGVTVE